MNHFRLSLTLILFVLGAATLPAQPPDPPTPAPESPTLPAQASDPKLPAPELPTLPAQALDPKLPAPELPALPAQASDSKQEYAGAKPSEAARWNNRTTPRKMLETFYFAITGYDRSPSLIVNAIDCLDLTGLDPEMRERDAALLAHQLEFILNRQGIPLYSVPDHSEGDRVVLDDVAGQPIALTKQPDGLWQFDSVTVGRIGRLRKLASAGQHEAQEARSKMAEGRTDPAATIRTFAGSAMGRRDFAAAARCLDLRDIPSKLRATEGAQMARKLAFVMQRCGFMFSQEVPNDPEGYRYVWHSNHRGRIMLERVRLPEGQDAWLFTRGSLRNLDALVEGFRTKTPDPRYATIGVVIGEEVLVSDRAAKVPPPVGVPAGLGSPRKTLRLFLESMDELEFDADRSRDLLACLELDSLAPEVRTSMGLRLAAKLEAVLHRLHVDLMSVADTWEADPLVLGRDTDWQVTLARSKDGAWRFDRETVSRVPDLFERLTPEEKTARERRSNFHSAQQVMRTLLHASDAGDLDLAARCLDLDGVPQGARDELGSILAYKLKFVLDRIGRVVVEELPAEADGPRYHYYRGPLGRIDLVRRTEEPRLGDWQFSRETVARIESMFREVADRPVDATLSRERAVTAVPSIRVVPSLWLRSQLPAWLRGPAPGLDLYQWVGLVVALATCAVASWLGLRVIERLACYGLRWGGFDLDRTLVAGKLRPLSFQLGLFCLYHLLRLLDLPSAVVGSTIPAVKVIWIGLMGWTALRLIDLGMILYARSERLHDRRSLSDMIVPTAANGMKLAVLVVVASCQVYLIGSRETLTQLLAGLGLVGLAASLAAQDTLKNFFGTLLLIGEHPFRIGEHVAVQNVEGTVESVGFRSTRLRTFEDSLLTIPNSVMAAALIDNRGARTCRRFRATISLAYGTPTDKLVALRDALRAFAASQPRFIPDKVEIHIGGLTTTCVELFIQLFFRVPSFTEEMACRDLLSREILAQAERLGVELAFPTQTIHLAGSGADLAPVPPTPKHFSRDRPEASRHGRSFPSSGFSTSKD
ncbi:mechanosensitive ion channel family protein [Singulisphaera acidiphila]|uniref:Small-conductance mechanosensitive channel n=1 Tax=Singulisphaera acidiphila (strain ATCC BAA-1392 / DSM 18658 / VKM B-2454 / MOB10) TaxID=886293 RepID=L0DQA0_SINAD|nr:mechanosensitive ion channel domain-containing protein [Singulisphaera acidiphila]AGA31030.1 small-conductance mechanosensitive channel [Singulisphaera acidiphila DSM 18658]